MHMAAALLTVLVSPIDSYNRRCFNMLTLEVNFVTIDRKSIIEGLFFKGWKLENIKSAGYEGT